MKTAEIKVDESYVAKVTYMRARAKVRALEVGVRRGVGYGGLRHERADGVRVVLEEDVATYSGGTIPHGTEAQVTSRDIERPWTEEDDARLLQRQERIDRAQEITKRLVAAGFGDGSDFWARGGEVVLTFEAVERLLEGRFVT